MAGQSLIKHVHIDHLKKCSYSPPVDSWVPKETEEEPDGGMDTCDKTTNTGPDLIADPERKEVGLKVGHYQPKLNPTQERTMTEDTQARIKAQARDGAN